MWLSRRERRQLCYRSFISSRVYGRDELTCRRQSIRESTVLSRPPVLHCSNHSPKAASKVVRRDRATRRACSISIPSALKVIFFMSEPFALFARRVEIGCVHVPLGYNKSKCCMTHMGARSKRNLIQFRSHPRSIG